MKLRKKFKNNPVSQSKGRGTNRWVLLAFETGSRVGQPGLTLCVVEDDPKLRILLSLSLSLGQQVLDSSGLHTPQTSLLPTEPRPQHLTVESIIHLIYLLHMHFTTPTHIHYTHTLYLRQSRMAQSHLEFLILMSSMSPIDLMHYTFLHSGSVHNRLSCKVSSLASYLIPGHSPISTSKTVSHYSSEPPVLLGIQVHFQFQTDMLHCSS